ncbi:MAG: hypothetical protein EBU90_09560 [Proteobacteria bacterium]|nr:hypothetical protein [Pseudomonadota bacterium]NBP14381.1 hypothetical protein [bacterium]
MIKLTLKTISLCLFIQLFSLEEDSPHILNLPSTSQPIVFLTGISFFELFDGGLYTALFSNGIHFSVEFLGKDQYIGTKACQEDFYLGRFQSLNAEESKKLYHQLEQAYQEIKGEIARVQQGTQE